MAITSSYKDPLVLVPAKDFTDWNPNQKQINIKIASGRCPTTFDLLKKINNLSSKLVDESQGFSFQKLFTTTVAGLAATAIFIGASYLEPYREPSAAQFPIPVPNPALPFPTPPLLLTQGSLDSLFEEIPPTRVDSNADKQLIVASGQQLIVPSPASRMAAAPTPSFLPTITSIGWTVSGIFAWKYGTKYSDWKVLQETAQEIQTSLPMVESELTNAKLDPADIDAITSLFNAQRDSFLKISPQRRNMHVTWMNALLATAAGCVYGSVAYGTNNMALAGILGPIYFPSIDLLLNQVLSIPKGEEQIQVFLNKQTQKYLS